MVALDSYEIIIKTEERELQIDVNQLGFKMKSSIWKILPTGYLVLKDSSGILQEFLLTTPGTPISISYGYTGTNEKIQQKYIVNRDLINDTESQVLINGDVELSLIHDWITKQKSSTEGFNGRISDVISSLVGKDVSTEIDQTENDNTWYQMGMLQKDFIEEVLLPKAVTTASEKTPFFCFIDNNNTFKFKSYNNLYNTNPIKVLSYQITTENEYNTKILLDLARERRSYIENLYDNKISIFSIDLEDGSLVDEEDTLIQYPSIPPNEYIPRKVLENSTATEFYDRAFDLEDIRGNRIFRLRKSISQDRFILIGNFDPNLMAGKVVTLKNFTSQKNEESPSTISQFSGKYLIEECEHIWDGISKGGAITKLLISRKYAKYSNNYVLKGGMTNNV